jgi:hypothetical protein
MRSVRKIFSAVVFILAIPVLATAGTMATYLECQDGCPIGNQDCYAYCSSLFDPCLDECTRLKQEFIPSCVASDREFPNDATRYTYCRDLMYTVFDQCNSNCNSIKKEVDYPNWMGEQECPYDCQRWNPTSRTCVGAAMNGCR